MKTIVSDSEGSPMMIVLDRDLTESILEKRRARGNRTREEVWDGVTYIMPDPNNEHQNLAMFFGTVFNLMFGLGQPNQVQGSPNLSDRIDDWEHNYRNPDMAYFSADCQAEDHGSFWYGGPDFLLEIISPDDMSRDKLPFYASIGTREVLILDRDPWQLELYHLRRNRLRLAGKARPGQKAELTCSVVPVAFSLHRGKARPKVRIRNTEFGQDWTF
jgi:Uma2 family endonuclease